MNNWTSLCEWCKTHFGWDERRVYEWLLKAEAETMYDMDLGDMIEALEAGTLQFTMNDAKVWVIEHDDIQSLFEFIKDSVVFENRR